MKIKNTELYQELYTKE
jgi:hypothetical protein